jgi:hypothetical protein
MISHHVPKIRHIRAYKRRQNTKPNQDCAMSQRQHQKMLEGEYSLYKQEPRVIPICVRHGNGYRFGGPGWRNLCVAFAS